MFTLVCEGDGVDRTPPYGPSLMLYEKCQVGENACTPHHGRDGSDSTPHNKVWKLDTETQQHDEDAYPPIRSRDGSDKTPLHSHRVEAGRRNATIL